MKNLLICCVLLGCIGLESCSKKQNDGNTSPEPIEKPMRVDCYKALYEEDTIDLKINTLKNGKISGDMVMRIANMSPKVGEIIGEFRGDTLFAAYTFTEGANKKVTFKNPMAFLKRGKELILGNGKIETTMGASYFIKGEPIDFDNVKYKFTTVDCVVK